MGSDAAPLRSRYGSIFLGELRFEGVVVGRRHDLTSCIQRGIEQLKTVRELVASDGSVVISMAVGFGKAELDNLAALELFAAADVQQPQLLHPGSRVITTDWPSGQASAFSGETLQELVAPVGAIRVPDLPQTPAGLPPPYRPADQWWCNLAAFARWEGWIHRSDAHRAKPSPERYESHLITLVIDLDRLHRLRAGLLRVIDSVLAALRLALVLVLAAYAYCPASRSFTLTLVATFRHYGHRGEPDDHALAAYRSMSVIGGEPAFSC